MAIEHALARLADTLAAVERPHALTLRLGTVANVSGSGDSAVVTVTVGSDQIAAPRLASYGSPSSGDTVAVLLVAGSPLILGRVTGTPSAP